MVLVEPLVKANLTVFTAPPLLARNSKNASAQHERTKNMYGIVKKLSALSLLVGVALNASPLYAQVDRTADQITLVETRTVSLNSNASWELNFYRNEAYTCGLSGNYTFFVMEPANNPGAEAPLWAYLHGGGYGWFDENQVYQAVKTQNQNTFNNEESFDDLIDNHLVSNTMRNGEVMDSTLTRRIQEGYRVLLVSMCDHDNYSGRGTPYPNNPNPNGGERQVNGLQATMAALDYTVANYPTTDAFAHGTSAGSLGVFAMSQAYFEEGAHLTAIVADSWAFTPPRIFDLFNALVGVPGYVFNAGADLENDGMAKVGYDYLGLGIYPEAVIEGGFVEVPSMYIIGEKDPGCGGYRDGILEAIPQAAAAGLSNCAWQYDDLRDAIENQPDSPHVFDLSPTGDHVETNRNNPVNDRVDNFITGVLATNPPQHFGDADDDGIPDYVDNCRGIANPDQAPSLQDPQCGAACVVNACGAPSCSNPSL